MKSNRAFTLVQLLIILAIIFVLVGFIAGSIGGCSRSEGVRSGTLVKFSYKGIFQSTKSWEGELVMDGLRAGSHGSTANTWAFSVIDSGMAGRLEPLVGKPVKLRYRETFARNPLKRSTRYLIVGVETLTTPTKVEP